VRRDADDPRDRYLCAGSPWYLTLFGRDSLWAAHMLLPVDREIALGTLRALARRQGTQDDPTTGEQPGKILHELRDPEVAEFLPPRYYGTVDATSLWVVLLVDTWRWGAAREEIAPLVPHLEAALAWIAQRASEDGYLRYTPDPDGLANQGWKDSTDAIHLADGTLLPGSVALAEAQGYAYRAAAGAADLLEALGQGDPSRWRRWAAGLAVRFGTDFWVRTGAGRHPALALGPDGTRASAAASNMGHLLGTGILTPQDAAHVAAVLGSPALDSGFGLRTLTSESPRYDPLSYHNGSVWPHDTAIAVAGLVAEGHGEVAGPLARGILDAAASFDHRLPELWGGGPAAGAAGGSSPRPLPYPTACSPQAWAATTAISLITSALGLQVDVPAGRLVLAPPRPALLGPLGVRGLRVGTGELDVDLTADGGVTVLRAPEGLSVEVRRG
jgi:glycogen debranching enzyme